jgi:hypothetical protein
MLDPASEVTRISTAIDDGDPAAGQNDSSLRPRQYFGNKADWGVLVSSHFTPFA